MTEPSAPSRQFVADSKFTIKNLRCFRQSSTISLGQINLIFGANNSGKSTLTKAIMAMSRILTTPRSVTEMTTTQSRPPLLFRSPNNNELTRTFKVPPTQLSFGGTKEPIELTIQTEWPWEGPETQMEVSMSIAVRDKAPLRSVKLFADDELAADWSRDNFGISSIGSKYIHAARLASGQAEPRSGTFLLGKLGFHEEPGSQSNGVTAAGIVQTLVELGTGIAPSADEVEPRREIRRFDQVPAGVNKIIKDVGSSVRVANPRSSNGQLYDDASGLVFNLDQVGSGIGQIIAVAARIDRGVAKSRSLVSVRTFPLVPITEPEAHLHPRLQAELGEALCRAALENPMRLIIETHSDALLFRALRLVRTGQIPADSLRIIFVEQEQATGESTARNIPISSSGALLEPFPIGFLDWGLEDLVP
jgi:ABC-type thiamine transport system ATPase subunit